MIILLDLLLKQETVVVYTFPAKIRYNKQIKHLDLDTVMIHETNKWKAYEGKCLSIQVRGRIWVTFGISK